MFFETLLALTLLANTADRDQVPEPRPVIGQLEIVAADSQNEGGYILGAEDLLEIKVVDVESVTRTVRVSEDGGITLPLLGEIQVAGLTRSDLERSLASRLQERFVHDPQVSVFVKEYGSKMISVLGAVDEPGRYPMLGRRTLLDMISQAGGLTEEAGPVAVITRRPHTHNGAPQTIQVNLNALLYQGQVEENLEVIQGDLIHIPVDHQVQVYVHGAVNKPGEYETRQHDPLTVLQAITKAGGTTPRAALKKVELLRRRPDGSKETIPVNLKAIMRGEAEDFELQDGDVLVVPETYF